MIIILTVASIQTGVVTKEHINCSKLRLNWIIQHTVKYWYLPKPLIFEIKLGTASIARKK